MCRLDGGDGVQHGGGNVGIGRGESGLLELLLGGSLVVGLKIGREISWYLAWMKREHSCITHCATRSIKKYTIETFSWQFFDFCP